MFSEKPDAPPYSAGPPSPLSRSPSPPLFPPSYHDSASSPLLPESVQAEGSPRWLRSGDEDSKPSLFARAPKTTRLVCVIILVGLLFMGWPSRSSGWGDEEVEVEVGRGEKEASEPLPSPLAEAPIAEVAEEEVKVVEPVEVVEPSGVTPLAGLECGDACKWLFVGHIGGQETRAQEHLYRFGLMALAMNRTLVLPNMAESQFGACMERRFDFFYALDSLSSFGIPTVTQSVFESWLDARQDGGRTASAQAIGITKEAGSKKPVILEGASVPTQEWFDLHPCLADFKLDYTDYEPVEYRGYWDRDVPASNWLVTTLVSRVRDGEGFIPAEGKEKTEPDVVHVVKIAPFWKGSAGGVDLATVKTLNPTAILPTRPFDHLVYSPALANMTKALATKLAPFVAIHWRTEQLKVGNLGACADGLIRTLTELKRRRPELTNVYLATDYPFESLQPGNTNGAAHSASYKIPKEAHQAMKKLYSWFVEGDSGLRQTSWSKEEPTLELPEASREILPDGVKLRELDLSLLGMVDKSILWQADYFVAGSQNVCGKRSSWTASVLTGRTEALNGLGEFAGEELMNTVEWFTL